MLALFKNLWCSFFRFSYTFYMKRYYKLRTWDKCLNKIKINKTPVTVRRHSKVWNSFNTSPIYSTPVTIRRHSIVTNSSREQRYYIPSWSLKKIIIVWFQTNSKSTPVTTRRYSKNSNYSKTIASIIWI